MTLITEGAIFNPRSPALKDRPDRTLSASRECPRTS